MNDFQPKFLISNAIARDLTTIERARGFFQAATLSDQWIARMSERAMLLEAYHTTHIEGTQLTLEQSEILLAGGTVDGASPDDVRELLNYREAFDLVSQYLLSGAPVTETLIREIHRRLVEGVRGNAGQPGAYRQLQNAVVNSQTGQVIYTPPAWADVPGLMAQLVQWINRETDIHPILVAGLAQFQLVHIHPFVDGNGRTSRLLSTLCMYRQGYDFKRLFTISEYYDRDRRAFYAAIQGVRDSGMDHTGWLEFFCQGLATQMQEAVERGTRAIKADLAVRGSGLPARAADILYCLSDEQPRTIEDLEKEIAGSHRRTLQRDLKKLIELGFIESIGQARATQYCFKDGGFE
ncbi:MAG: Fic family protein [Planctomycetaceae bacterium]|nr:Fic family protein [Planctomycetaceae bacterium]